MMRQDLTSSVFRWRELSRTRAAMERAVCRMLRSGLGRAWTTWADVAVACA